MATEFYIAPMMALTDRHYRTLVRQLSRHAVLYTEMLTADAVLHGDRDYLLGHDAIEQPLVLQLGGSDAPRMAEAARIGEQYGYREININAGCPSDRVQAGRFGACLMREPGTVAACVEAMRRAVSVPVTVKCRIGVDDDDDYSFLYRFVDTVADAGCEHFIIHARKAWLNGLSPKENREIPPLHPERVYRLKADRPELRFTVNGGLNSWEAITPHWQGALDGVMVGRHAYYHPAFLLDVDQRCYGEREQGIERIDPREQLVAAARHYGEHMAYWSARGVRVNAMSRHLVALFEAVPGARRWRRRLSEEANGCSDPIALVERALAELDAPASQVA